MQKGPKLQRARAGPLCPFTLINVTKKKIDRHCRGRAPPPSPLNPPLKWLNLPQLSLFFAPAVLIPFVFLFLVFMN